MLIGEERNAAVSACGAVACGRWDSGRYLIVEILAACGRMVVKCKIVEIGVGLSATDLKKASYVKSERDSGIFRGALRELGFGLESLEVQGSYGSYQHKELEGEEMGTVFDKDGLELRMTAVHSPLAWVTGAFGLHLRDETFDAMGEEAFVPSNETVSFGLFAVERLNRDWGAWEFDGRIESVDIDLLDGSLESRQFTTANASAGFVRNLGRGEFRICGTGSSQAGQRGMNPVWSAYVASLPYLFVSFACLLRRPLGGGAGVFGYRAESDRAGDRDGLRHGSRYGSGDRATGE